MVECDLAKVDVASSNLVSRSKMPVSTAGISFFVVLDLGCWVASRARMCVVKWIDSLL